MRMLLIVLTGALALAGCQSSRTAHPLPEACFQEPDAGQCRAAMPRFYYDAETDRCEPFTWGGCEGNVPFETLESCMASCYAPAPDLRGENGAHREMP